MHSQTEGRLQTSHGNSVRPCMEQRDSHRTEFREILFYFFYFFKILRKPVEGFNFGLNMMNIKALYVKT